MKIGLASKEFKNNDVSFNLKQMIETMKEAKDLGCDLVCFGEAFLQGFDAYEWGFENDKAVALDHTSVPFQTISYNAFNLGIDVAFGYLERSGDTLFSSYVLMEYGQVIHNYRRISRGWKEYRLTDEHYQEGDTVEKFNFRDHEVVVSLCGDLWDEPQRFALGQSLTLWPVYVDYSVSDWDREREAYAKQTAHLSGDVLLVNSICHPTAVGGAFHYRNGQIIQELSPGTEGILVISLD